MTKEKTLFILGIWIIILPYLGFPRTWKEILFVITGVLVMVLSYLMYRHKEVLDRLLRVKDERDETVDYRADMNALRYHEHTKERPTVARNNRAGFEDTPASSRQQQGPLIHPIGATTDPTTVRPRRRITRKKVVEETVIRNDGNGAEVIEQTSINEDPSY